MIKQLNRKSLIIRPSGRSTDYISPSFGYGCLYNCSYCYMKRHKPEGLDIANNTEEILTAINNHCWFADVDKPNQTHEEFITYDISCNEDFSLHAKYHDWKKIFTFFVNNSKAMGSFATKYVNKELLKFNPERKIRIRFSLMPYEYRELLEPNTSLIIDRILAVNEFYKAGYDVHLNFSPVIVTDKWLDKYQVLFEAVDKIISNDIKDNVKCEVIFLTHNENKHNYNLANKITGEHLLWNSEVQEPKISQYGGNNVRYKHDLKSKYIDEFIDLHDKIIPWNYIRYIF